MKNFRYDWYFSVCILLAYVHYFTTSPDITTETKWISPKKVKVNFLESETDIPRHDVTKTDVQFEL